jgi:SAM-dependent methyltransferase
VSDQSPCTGLLYGEQPNLSLLQFAGALRGRILDLGCGAGAWAELLRNVGGRQLISGDISRRKLAMPLVPSQGSRVCTNLTGRTCA